MNMNELETWIKTSEGQAWAETLKKPLIDKRDELLIELKAVNGRLASETQRATENEQQLAAERRAVEKIIIDEKIADAMREIGLPDLVMAPIISKVKEVNGLKVNASGDDRTMIGENGEPVDPKVIRAQWAQTPEGKQFMASRAIANQGMPPRGTTETVSDEMAFRRAMGLKN